MTAGWPDLVIGAAVLYCAWKGFRNGFVTEVGRPVAVLIAIVAAFRYPGSLDDGVASVTGLRSGSAHAIGTVVFAIVVYAVVILVAWLLGRVASLPGIGIVNAAGGTLVGAAKALLGTWIVLYVSLFFPLTPDLRAALHASPLVHVVTQPDAALDATVRTIIPSFAWPVLQALFTRHQV